MIPFFSADFVEGIGVQNCDVFLIFVFLNEVSSIVAVEKVNKESVFLYLDKVLVWKYEMFVYYEWIML